MKSLNNRGSALLTTLLIITLIFIFSAVLISIALNSAKQTQVSEKQIHATNLAEIAVMYFQEYALSQIDVAENQVKAYQTTNPKATSEQIIQFFCTKLQLSNLATVPITTDRSFSAKISNVTINKSDCNELLVRFVSEGIFNGFTKKIEGSFIIKNNSITAEGSGISTVFPKIPSNFKTNCNSFDNCFGTNNVVVSGNAKIDKKDTTTMNGLYINGSLDMSGTHSDLVIPKGNFYVNGATTIGNQSTITVGAGNAYFKNITGSSNAEILINGDAYIYGDVTNFKTNSGNQLFVNITGTVYVSEKSDLPANYRNYCDRSKSRGICASNYKYIKDAPATNPDIAMPGKLEADWSLDEPSFEIEYK
ncbi:hypothetical protein M670_01232 [Schinkia azotoformans MEV2011]|uniref:Uncharacterized protein n=1 Tax=Schinkia azotoformans MEV2011 TaxID=1348973 RepID=A0A072NP67_SCHAZ|nr:hypothetical protein M670_01232 [Schinkia azotoformans MEV2011]